MENLKESVLDIYASIEEKYYFFLDFFDGKGIPVYSLVDVVESRNIPSFPIILIFLIAILATTIFFTTNTIVPLTFKITVVDSENNAIQGVSINALFESTGLKSFGQTMSDGSFYISSPPIEEFFKIILTKEGYEEKSIKWLIKTNGDFQVGENEFKSGTPAKITMINKTVSFGVSFLVKNSNDEVLSGKVTIFSVDDENNKTIINDAVDYSNGVFSFYKFEKNKKYVLEFNSEGYFGKDVKIDVESENNQKTITLVKSGFPPSETKTVTLPVEIKNKFGEAIAGINIAVKRTDSTLISTNTTYASGVASLTQIPTGVQIEIVAMDPNGIYLTKRTPFFEIKTSQSVEKKEIIMSQSEDENQIAVNVTTKYFGSIFLADITLLKDSKIIDSKKTNSDGKAIFSEEKGIFNISAYKTNYLPSFKKGVSSGEITTFELEESTTENSANLNVCVKKNLTPVNGVSVSLWVENNFLGLPMKTTENEGCALFVDVPVGLKLTVKAESLNVTGQKTGVEVEVGKTNETIISLDSKNEKIIVNVEKSSNGAEINDAIVSVYDFETKQELSKKTKGKNGKYEMQAPQGTKVYVTVEKNNYLDFISSPVLVVVGGAKIAVKMYSESSNQSIDFQGLFDSVGNQKYAVAVGKTYRAVFNVLIPKSSDGNSILMLSVGQRSNLDSSNWTITGFSPTVGLESIGGSELESTSLLSESGWKWISFTKTENSTSKVMVYQVEAWLTVKSDAVEEDIAIFNFKGDINKKDTSFTEQKFLVVAEEEMCDKNICFSVLFKNKKTKNYFPSGMFSTTTTDKFIVEFSAYLLDERYFEGYKLNVSPDTSGSVEFEDFDIGGITSSASANLTRSISVELKDHASDLLKGKIELSSRIISDGIGINFVFLKGNGKDMEEETFTIYFDSTGDKLFDVQILPSTTLLEGKNQIKLVVTEAGTDKTVNEATVRLSNKTSESLGKDVTYSINGFKENDLGYGKDGVYIFPEPNEFFYLEEGSLNARISAENFKPKNVDINISKEFDSNLKLTDLEGNDSIVVFEHVKKGDMLTKLRLENIGSKDIRIIVADIVPRNKTSDFSFHFKNDILNRKIENNTTLDFDMKSTMTVESVSDSNFEGYIFVAGTDTNNKLHIATLPFKVIAKGRGNCFKLVYGSNGNKNPEFFFDSINRKRVLTGIQIKNDCSCDITSFSESVFTSSSGDEIEANAFDLNVALKHHDGGTLEDMFSKWKENKSSDEFELFGEISSTKEITSNLNISGSYVLKAQCSDKSNIVEASWPKVSINLLRQKSKKFIQVLKLNTQDVALENISFNSMCVNKKNTASVKFDLKNVFGTEIDNLHFKLFPESKEKNAEKGLKKATIQEIKNDGKIELDKESIFNKYNNNKYKLIDGEKKTFKLNVEVSEELNNFNGNWKLGIYIGNPEDSKDKSVLKYEIDVDIVHDEECVFENRSCEQVTLKWNSSKGKLQIINNLKNAFLSIKEDKKHFLKNTDDLKEKSYWNIDPKESKSFLIKFEEIESDFNLSFDLKENDNVIASCNSKVKKTFYDCSDLNSKFEFDFSGNDLNVLNKNSKGVIFIESSMEPEAINNYGYGLKEIFVGATKKVTFKKLNIPSSKLIDFKVNVLGTECTVRYDALYTTQFGLNALVNQPITVTKNGFDVNASSVGYSNVAALFNGNKITVNGVKKNGFLTSEIVDMVQECKSHYCDQTTFKLLIELYLMLVNAKENEVINVEINGKQFAIKRDDSKFDINNMFNMSAVKLGGISITRLNLLNWDDDIGLLTAEFSNNYPIKVIFKSNVDEMACGVWDVTNTVDSKNIINLTRSSEEKCGFGIINLPKFFPLFFAPVKEGEGNSVQNGSYSSVFEDLFDVEYSNTAGKTGLDGVIGNLSNVQVKDDNKELNMFTRYIGENIDEFSCDNEKENYKNACLRLVNILNKYNGIFSILTWDPTSSAGTNQKVSVIVKGNTQELVNQIQKQYLEILNGKRIINGKSESDINASKITPVKIVKKGNNKINSPNEIIITGLIFGEGSSANKKCLNKNTNDDYIENTQPNLCFINSGRSLELTSCHNELNRKIVEFIKGFV